MITSTTDTFEYHRTKLLNGVAFNGSPEFISVTAHMNLGEVMVLTAAGAPNEVIGQALHDSMIKAVNELAEMACELEELS